MAECLTVFDLYRSFEVDKESSLLKIYRITHRCWIIFKLNTNTIPGESAVETGPHPDQFGASMNIGVNSGGLKWSDSPNPFKMEV